MNNNLNEYSDMLFEAAKEVFKIIKNPEANDENKIIIASVNALTTTTKMAIQNEVLKYRINNANGTMRQMIEKVNE
jgi:hypothetical protein